MLFFIYFFFSCHFPHAIKVSMMHCFLSFFQLHRKWLPGCGGNGNLTKEGELQGINFLNRKAGRLQVGNSLSRPSELLHI